MIAIRTYIYIILDDLEIIFIYISLRQVFVRLILAKRHSYEDDVRRGIRSEERERHVGTGASQASAPGKNFAKYFFLMYISYRKAIKGHYSYISIH